MKKKGGHAADLLRAEAAGQPSTLTAHNKLSTQMKIYVYNLTTAFSYVHRRHDADAYRVYDALLHERRGLGGAAERRDRGRREEGIRVSDRYRATTASGAERVVRRVDTGAFRARRSRALVVSGRSRSPGVGQTIKRPDWSSDPTVRARDAAAIELGRR